MTAYVPYLTEIPDSAFTSKSAEFVAMQDRAEKVPDLAELKNLLQTWVLSRAPKPEVGPAMVGLTPADESWLQTWHRHQASGFRDYAGCPRYPNVTPDTPENHLRAHLASLIRHVAPAAWARIAAGQA